ncbi:MAG: lytic transglycosylase domain-containing protein [Syntrophales bacterium]|nr:lytic transglycosylase domain-containing protein [Syntrophales bacterium]
MSIDCSKSIGKVNQVVEPKASNQEKIFNGCKEKNTSNFKCLLKDILNSPVDLERVASESYLRFFWRRHCVSLTLKEMGDLAEEGVSRNEMFLAGVKKYLSMSNYRQRFEELGGYQFSTPFDSIIEEASKKYGIDEALIKSVIQVESAFRVDAVSPKGAMGLMQLMPETAKELGVSDPYNPVENIMAGTSYLRRLIDRYGGDLIKALAAYNWGPGNVDEYFDKMPEETRNYVSKVLRLYSLTV